MCLHLRPKGFYPSGLERLATRLCSQTTLVGWAFSPPLKEKGQDWVMDSKGKANLFVDIFTEKNKLIFQNGQIDTSNLQSAGSSFGGFIAVRTKKVRKISETLDTEIATGHDELPATILKKCASSLAWPIAKLCRQIFWTGVWFSF